MRILHLPTPTGGNAWGLSQAERKIGHKSQVLISSPNPYQYKSDITIPRSILEREGVSGVVHKNIKFFTTFLKIRNKYDVFHFNFGSTLINLPRLDWYLCDLPYYSKKSEIFVTYNGCDARQRTGTITRTNISACHQKMCYNGICQDIKKDILKKRNIEKFSRYAHHIFALNPDLLNFLPEEKASFLPYTIHNWFDDDGENSSNVDLEKISIVHAPTNPIAKGTPFLLDAIEKLKNKYPDTFEFTLIQNLPFQEAIEAYQKADLIIDQLLIGWYGAFAVETMLMGKPVMAFIRESDLHFLPDRMADEVQKSIINTSIYNIEKDIGYIIENPDILKEYKRRSRRYVREWHDPIKIANDVVHYYCK